jgi:hypothetical protein
MEAATLAEHKMALTEVSETLEALRKIERDFGLLSVERRQLAEIITALLCSKDAVRILTELSCARQIRLRAYDWSRLPFFNRRNVLCGDYRDTLPFIKRDTLMDMTPEDYIEALKTGAHIVRATTKKGEMREYVGSLPSDAQQRVPGSDIVPILLEDGTYKSFDISRVIEFTRGEVEICQR